MTEIRMPRLLLIAGNGRNSGKTTFACSVIRNLNRQYAIIAIKISPHPYSTVTENGETGITFGISEETVSLSGKDSSRMLDAGAFKSFFITANESHLNKVAESIEMLAPPGSYILCESGGLRKHIEPGLFFIVSRKENVELKPTLNELTKKEHVFVRFDGDAFDTDPLEIGIDDAKKQWIIRND